jgi:hypothetical protein
MNIIWKKLKKPIENFFDSFSSDYDAIFISPYDPNSEPLYKEKLFSMRFKDKIDANIVCNISKTN